MPVKIRIAIDAMSGDLGPRVAVAAALKFAAMFVDVELLLVGDKPLLLSLLGKISKRFPAKIASQDRIAIIHAADIVAMDEDPLSALRHKQNSSMWCALDAVKGDRADACVSAGNTGALLAMGKYLLKTFPGVERPAICKAMPGEKNPTYMLDLGANINCSAGQLHQFALMGSVLSGLPAPRVGLLNIGREQTKGTDTIQAAQSLLKNDARLNYSGFVEASEIFSGAVDVVVCDGFHGNIALKSMEATARFIAQKIQRSLVKHWFNKMLGLLVWSLLKQWRTELDPSMYNGASFLGLQKTLVKSHGNADKTAFLQALMVAREQVIQNVPARIQQQLLI